MHKQHAQTKQLPNGQNVPRELRALTEEYRARFNPRNVTEALFVRILAQSAWRLLQLERFEAEIWNQHRLGYCEGAGRNGKAISYIDVADSTTKRLNRVHKLAATAQRQWLSARKELEKLGKSWPGPRDPGRAGAARPFVVPKAA